MPKDPYQRNHLQLMSMRLAWNEAGSTTKKNSRSFFIEDATAISSTEDQTRSICLINVEKLIFFSIKKRFYISKT